MRGSCGNAILPDGPAPVYFQIRDALQLPITSRKVQISMTGARDLLNAFRESLSADTVAGWEKKVAVLLHVIGGRRVGRRPGRCEPREVKRRPRSDWRVTKPRAERRAERLAN